ncbi:MAG TPA: alpha/beta hydrolase [Gemmatimonadaceae bacterium]|nr:alpha/beta hydrolase [Gemmatimonadaceae bacterium]
MDETSFRAMRRFADLSFGRIAYVERGSGAAALFVHAFPLNGFEWRGAIERLSPYRRCIAPDLMGLGYSEISETQDLAPAQQAAMLAAFLDRLSLRHVDLIANDSGGAVAQLFVAHYPRRVRTLLLTNCDVVIDSPPKALQPLLKAAHAGVFADKVLAPALADKPLARSPQSGFRGVYQDPANPTDEALDYYLAPVLSSPLRKKQVEKYLLALEQNPLAGIEPALRQATMPTRIVWGTGDQIFSPESPDWLDRAFPHSRGVRRVEGAKAFFPEEQPDIIAQEARMLWGSV